MGVWARAARHGAVRRRACVGVGVRVGRGREGNS